MMTCHFEHWPEGIGTTPHSRYGPAYGLFRRVSMGMGYDRKRIERAIGFPAAMTIWSAALSSAPEHDGRIEHIEAYMSRAAERIVGYWERKN